jgi:molybdopterin converting factor small subunit
MGLVKAFDIMNVTVNFLGLFKEYIGTEVVSIELPDDSVYADLLEEINRRYGEKLPPSLWDKSKREFKPGILCVGEGRDLEDGKTVLKSGETISIVVHLAGG